MARKQPTERIPPLSPEEADKYCKIIDNAALHFQGIADELEAAVGMLMIGRLYGWRVLYIIHSKRTIKKYEKILGGDGKPLDIKELFDEEGPLTPRSIGLTVAKALGNFWRVVSGDLKVPRRREFKRE